MNSLINKCKKTISNDKIVSLCYGINLLSIQYFENPLYTLIKYFTLFVVGIYIYSNLKQIKKIDTKLLLCVCLLGLFIVLSSLINGVPEFYIRASIYYSLFIIFSFLYIYILAKKMIMNVLFSVLKIYIGFLVSINDILMFFIPDKFYNIHGSDIGTCLLGNKFVVIYAHLLFLFLILITDKDAISRKKKLLVCILLMTFLAFFTDCMTGLLSVWLFGLLYFITPYIYKYINKPMVYMVSMLFTSVWFVFYGVIVQLPFVKFIIENILHRDLSLTGRLEVWKSIFGLVSKSPFIGYGYGTTIVQDSTIWYANAQSAFWDFVLRYGLLSAFILLVLVFIVFKKKQIKSCYQCYIVLNILYTYLLLGMSEIVFTGLFFFYIAIYYGFKVTNNQEIDNYEK